MAHSIEPKTKIVAIKFTPTQHNLIEARAKRRGVKMRVWMRLILLAAAKSNVSEGYLRIREPDEAT